MKYFIVTYTIRDGDYEYLQQLLSSGKNEEVAVKKVESDILDWIGEDYRLHKINNVVELTKEEFEVLNKYVY